MIARVKGPNPKKNIHPIVNKTSARGTNLEMDKDPSDLFYINYKTNTKQVNWSVLLVQIVTSKIEIQI